MNALPPVGLDRERAKPDIKKQLCREYMKHIIGVPFKIKDYSAQYGNFGVLVVRPESNDPVLRNILPLNPHVSLIREDEKIKKRFKRPSHVDSKKMNQITIIFSKACIDLAVGNTLAFVDASWCARN